MIDSPCTYVTDDNRTIRGFIRSVGWTNAGASVIVEIEGGKLVEVVARLVTVTPQVDWTAIHNAGRAFDTLRDVSGAMLAFDGPLPSQVETVRIVRQWQKRLEEARMFLWSTDARVDS